MAVIDAHCDVLSKLLQHPGAAWSDTDVITATLPRQAEGGLLLQGYAIYIDEAAAASGFEQILRSVDLFYEKIVAEPRIVQIREKADLMRLAPGRQIGALLTLEGVDALPADPLYVRLLFRLGVRAIGLTWNHANWAADGVGEPRGGGLTMAGRQLVRDCDKLGIMIDVSHLSVQGFWDVAELKREGVFASHSNVIDLCPHPRNLSQDQIDHLIGAEGMIGLTFVPYFVSRNKKASMRDLLMHIEYICERGGASCIGFGSDFDGTPEMVSGLEHPGCYAAFRDELSKHYHESDIEGWMYKNWLDYLNKHLPD